MFKNDTNASASFASRASDSSFRQTNFPDLSHHFVWSFLILELLRPLRPRFLFLFLLWLLHRIDCRIWLHVSELCAHATRV